MTGAMARSQRWSEGLTSWLADLVPARHQPQALYAIRATHTALFGSIAAALLLTLWDGVRGRPRRRTAIAGGVVFAETAVYLSNNQVCPLTPLAERLGAERGAVADMLLPAWAARRIPVVAGSMALAALALNARGLRSRVGLDSAPR